MINFWNNLNIGIVFVAKLMQIYLKDSLRKDQNRFNDGVIGGRKCDLNMGLKLIR